ncbi:MAG: hypothetical protein RIT22_167 [Bacteroidota bacterium]|jgi:DNA-binding NarL/FixJ family response regulator
MKRTTPYCFLIADDHSIVRNGLALVIRSTFEDAFIYQAGTFNEIQSFVTEIKIDFLILDISFPEGSVLRMLPGLKALQPNMKILMFSSFDEEVYALRYIKAGADGYLSKLSTPEVIQQALKTMIREGKYTSDSIKDKIVDSYMLKKPDNPLEELSHREMEIATLLVKGYGNLEISNELDLKATTVSTYKTRVFEKLNITTLPALIQKFDLYHDTTEN